MQLVCHSPPPCLFFFFSGGERRGAGVWSMKLLWISNWPASSNIFEYDIQQAKTKRSSEGPRWPLRVLRRKTRPPLTIRFSSRLISSDLGEMSGKSDWKKIQKIDAAVDGHHDDNDDNDEDDDEFSRLRLVLYTNANLSKSKNRRKKNLDFSIWCKLSRLNFRCVISVSLFCPVLPYPKRQPWFLPRYLTFTKSH